MEIETKAKIKDFEKIKQKLEKIGVKFKKSVHQKDDYYKRKGTENDPQKPGSSLIRIRQQEDKHWLTIKVLTKKTGAWIEHETEITDAKETEQILKYAEFAKVLTISKERISGKLGKVGICMDKINGLGHYIEFEIISENVEKAKNEINKYFNILDISEEQIEHRGYAAIIFQKRGISYEGTKG